MLDFDPLSLSLPQALASALRRLAHLAHTSSWDQWAAQRLTPTQRRILDVVASRRESLSLSALAREIGVTPATASDSAGALESKGLVQKRRSYVDGRALALMLTSEGRSYVTALADRHLRLECPEHLPGDEARQNDLWERFNSPPAQPASAPG
jgi:DNA-binding MarR family transcriptional regulator